MVVANIIAMVLVLIGALNWGLIGLFAFNLVEYICMRNNIVSRIIYSIVLLAAIWLIISWAISGSIIMM